MTNAETFVKTGDEETSRLLAAAAAQYETYLALADTGNLARLAQIDADPSGEREPEWTKPMSAVFVCPTR